MSGSEIDDGTDKATAWKRRLDIIILKLREAASRKTKGKQRTSQGTSDGCVIISMLIDGNPEGPSKG
jgi:hypothetical protein